MVTKENHELYITQMEKRKTDKKIYHNNKFSKQKKFRDEGENVYIKDLYMMGTLLKESYKGGVVVNILVQYICPIYIYIFYKRDFKMLSL